MNTKVVTYLKIGEQFIPIEEYSGMVPDEYYVEGAIYCKINGQIILELKHWDLVDQLWVYIVQGLVALDRNEMYESSFPDQPRLLRVEPVAATCARITIGEVSYEVDRESFVRAMKEGAERFFASITRLCPASKDTWDRYLTEVRSLKP